MTRRFLISSLVVGLLALGGLNAQAGTLPLPQTLAALEGNSAIVDNLEFSNFTYSVNPTAPPTAANVAVNPFTAVVGEPGINFTGAFTAAAGSTVDYAITYTVTTTDGSKINDAYLSLGGFANSGGTGSVSIGETIFNSSGTVISKVPFEVFTSPLPGQLSDTSLLTLPETTITVEKDITVVGGSNGAVFSFTNQGFSTTDVVAAVPEPASMALLGIGLSGLFTLRRFLKRTSVA